MVQVVVAEGDRDVRNSVMDALARAGYPVLEAGTGLSTLIVMAASATPLVVVMDAHLPDLDGPQIVRFARAALKEDGQAEVVMMTDGGATGLADYTPNGDGVRFLARPFALDDLLGAVRDAERRLGGMVPITAYVAQMTWVAQVALDG